MQLIINFLQAITEGLASLQEFAYNSIMDLVNLMEYLTVSVEVGANMLVWCPIFLREVIGSMLIIYVLLRIVGRD